MTTILAVDASTNACSVALFSRGQVFVDSRMLPRAHTQFLLPMIDELLTKSSTSMREVQKIAFAAGPGSFTGLRVCVGTVQGLAFALDIPVIPVSTLQVMAQLAIDEYALAEGSLIFPALDARMGELYWGQYRAHNGVATANVADMLIVPASIQVSSQVGLAVGVGDGWLQRESFAEVVGDIRVESEFYPRADALLTLAQTELLAAQAVAAEHAQPVYLRDSVAWKKSGKSV